MEALSLLNKKLLIVVCTKAKNLEEFQQRPIAVSLQKQIDSNHFTDFKLFTNNKKGLSTCYNEVLKDPEHIDKIVLFVHDDVELLDIMLYEKLMSSPYVITGLAGAKTFDKSSSSLAWHHASSEHVGEVAHYSKEHNKQWTTVFGSTKSRALILDGLFLAVKVKDLQEKKIFFDESFDFHFYDIAFCLRANKAKLTAGVIPLHVVHHGLGDSMMSAEWKEANETFKKTLNASD